MTGIERTVAAQANGHITHGIDSLGDRLHRKLDQFIGHTRQIVQGTADGIHRTGAHCRARGFTALFIRKGDGGGGAQAAAAADLHQLELEASFRLLHLFADDRLKITVGDLALAISEFLEAGKGLIEILTSEVVAQLLQSSANGTAAAQLAEGDAVVGQAHRLGVDDFVGEPILENAVLVDAGFMGEGIGTNDGLVGLHHHAGEIGDQP